MLSVFIKTIIIYIVLTVTMKIMGKRRIGELEADELVSTLLISELGAMPISDSSIPLINAIIPIIFIVAVEVALSAIKTKWRAAKHLLEGEPSYIIYKGKLLQNELERNRVSLNEVLAEMRSQGIGNITDVYYGVLEANGKLSLIKRSEGDDLGHAVIIDGELHEAELRAAGKDMKWLEKQLKEHSITRDNVLLLSVLDNGDTELIKKEKK
ncbi:MAG: DUF421 domain-containing protein [Clostridia bacterium]|nr:DUF421 domain-containing protein [Clostridia bacterium]